MVRLNTGFSRSWAPALPAAFGAGTIAVAWVIGLNTGWFFVHVAYPFGFWMAFEGLALWAGVPSLLRRRTTVLKMVTAGAAFGLVLDFYMVHLTGILDLVAVTDAGIALQMYLGWGLCFPAVYQSYRVVLSQVGGARALTRRARTRVPDTLYGPAGVLGFALAALPLFLHLWVGGAPGYTIVSTFTGLWMISEHVQHRRGRRGLVATFLELDPRPFLAMILASLPFTLLWERLNYLMGSWEYRNIFLLEPAPAGVPLVVFFGYLCGYYVLFLSLYNAIATESERDLAIFCARSVEQAHGSLY